jgi:hypothetical protein
MVFVCHDFKRQETRPSRFVLYQGCQIAIFAKQKFQFGYILKGLTMENVGTLHSQLVHFTANGYILSPSDIFRDHLVYFGIIYQKIWQRCFLDSENFGFPRAKIF